MQPKTARSSLLLAMAIAAAVVVGTTRLAAAAGAESSPVAALLDVATDAAVVPIAGADPSLARWNPYFCPGEPYRPVYTRRMTLARGDLLWIHAEVETTNDLKDPAGKWKTARLEMRLIVAPTAPGQAPATIAESSEGTYPRALHHVPLTAAAIYRASADGAVELRAEFRASVSGAVRCRIDSRDFIFLNQQYGGIQIARFRPFPDLAAAAQQHALALGDVRRSAEPAVRDFGRCVMDGAEMAAPYAIKLALDPGDVALAIGQTAVQPYPQPPSIAACGAADRFELQPPVSPEGCRSDAPGQQATRGMVPDDLHAVRIRASGAPVATFIASENVSPCLPQSTLFADAVLRPERSGESTVSTAVNGGTGYGGMFIPGGGEIVGLRFSPVARIGPAGLFVTDAGQVSAPATTVARQAEDAAPAAWSLLASRPVELPAKSQFWASAAAEVGYPQGVPENTCRSALLLRDEAGGIAGLSPIMARASTPDTVMLPLQNEAVFPVAKRGRYVIEMRADCGGASAHAGGGRLAYLVFAPQ